MAGLSFSLVHSCQAVIVSPVMVLLIIRVIESYVNMHYTAYEVIKIVVLMQVDYSNVITE